MASKEKGFSMLEENQLFNLVFMKNGEANQRRMAIEECSELIKALCKYDRYFADEDVDKRILRLNIIEEMADVEIMLEQLKLMFDFNGDFEKAKESKLKRLARRLGVE